MASAARKDFERRERFDSASSRFFVCESMRIESVSLMPRAHLYTSSHIAPGGDARSKRLFYPQSLNRFRFAKPSYIHPHPLPFGIWRTRFNVKKLRQTGNTAQHKRIRETNPGTG